jgi:hypothetical protein
VHSDTDVRWGHALTRTEVLEFDGESISFELTLHPIGRNDTVGVDRVARPAVTRGGEIAWW